MTNMVTVKLDQAYRSDQNVDNKSQILGRFEALDGLRGIAAIAVVFYHFGRWMQVPWLFRHGYLAVDLFFCLSGFVLASAYEEKLRSSISFTDFTLRRIVRLWPLILLGVVLGLIHESVRLLAGHGNFSGSELLTAVACGMLLIPMVWNHRTFPLNDPMWSLFFEVAINLVWAGSIRWLRTWMLAVVLVVSATSMALLAKAGGSLSGGHDATTFALGAARVVTSYTVGLLLFRLYRTGRVRISVPTSVLATALLALLAVPNLSDNGVLFDLAVALIAMPAIVFSAAGAVGDVGPFWRFSGHISYPLYVLHHPFWFISTGLLAAVGVAVSLPIAVVLAAVFTAASWLVLTVYDIPVRALLTARLKRGSRAFRWAVRLKRRLRPA